MDGGVKTPRKRLASCCLLRSAMVESSQPSRSHMERVIAYPEYSTYYERLVTFANWTPMNEIFTAEELALSGLFVADLVKDSKALFCFRCNLFVSAGRLQSSTCISDLHGDLSCDERSRWTEKTMEEISPSPPPLPPRRIKSGTAVEAWNRPSVAVLYQPPQIQEPTSESRKQSRPHSVHSDRLPASHSLPAPARPFLSKLKAVFSSSRPGEKSSEMNAVLAPKEDDSSLDSSWEDLGEKSCAQFPLRADGGGVSSPTVNPSMDTFEARLATFATWPRDHPQDPKTFAKYGMFYKGHGDYTECYSCGMVIWAWETYRGHPKAPLIAHKKFYRDCDFIKRRKWTDNAAKLSIAGAMINWENADSPFMMLQPSRLESFSRISAIDQERASDMADGGFFLLSDALDLKCFYCGVVCPVANMTDPWTVHAQLRPGCTYLNRKKGPLFIRKARWKLFNSSGSEDTRSSFGDGPAFAEGPHDNLGSVEKIVFQAVSLKNRIQKALPRLNPYNAATSLQKSTADAAVSAETTLSSARSSIVSVPQESLRPPGSSISSVVVPQHSSLTAAEVKVCSAVDLQKAKLRSIDAVIKMGFTPEQVVGALVVIDKQVGMTEVTAERLIDVIFCISERQSISRNRSHVAASPLLPASLPSTLTSADTLRTGNLKPCQEITHDSKDNEEAASSVRAGDAVSKERERLCVICLEKEGDFAFIPCGHVATCGSCSLVVEHCPMCRQTIRDRIRVYL